MWTSSRCHSKRNVSAIEAAFRTWQNRSVPDVPKGFAIPLPLEQFHQSNPISTKWRCAPRLVWEFYSMRRRVASAAKPNPAHFALAKLENTLQDRLFVCAQNVDPSSGTLRGRIIGRWNRPTFPEFHFDHYLRVTLIAHYLAFLNANNPIRI